MTQQQFVCVLIMMVLLIWQLGNVALKIRDVSRKLNETSDLLLGIQIKLSQINFLQQARNRYETKDR